MALSQSTSTHSTSHSQLPTVSADHLASLKQPSPAIQESAANTIPSAVADTATSRSSFNDTLIRPASNYKYRQSIPSTTSTKQNRTGIFTLAALARGKTASAIASLSEPALRPRLSSSSLYRAEQSSPTSASHNSVSLPKSADSQASTRESTHLPRGSTHTLASTSSHSRTESLSSGTARRQSLFETNPPSQVYSNTASSTPAPIPPQGNYNKMHQTSSRLLRMTTDDRPFTRVCTVGNLEKWPLR